jgi:hypothetical protein
VQVDRGGGVVELHEVKRTQATTTSGADEGGQQAQGGGEGEVRTTHRTTRWLVVQDCFRPSVPREDWPVEETEVG